MWVKGGNSIWGNLDGGAPDDLREGEEGPESEKSEQGEGRCAGRTREYTYGSLISFREKSGDGDGNENETGVHGHGYKEGNLTAEEAGNWILEHTSGSFQVLICVRCFLSVY